MNMETMDRSESAVQGTTDEPENIRRLEAARALFHKLGLNEEGIRLMAGTLTEEEISKASPNVDVYFRQLSIDEMESWVAELQSAAAKEEEAWASSTPRTLLQRTAMRSLEAISRPLAERYDRRITAQSAVESQGRVTGRIADREPLYRQEIERISSQYKGIKRSIAEKTGEIFRKEKEMTRYHLARTEAVILHADVREELKAAHNRKDDEAISRLTEREIALYESVNAFETQVSELASGMLGVDECINAYARTARSLRSKQRVLSMIADDYRRKHVMLQPRNGGTEGSIAPQEIIKDLDFLRKTQELVTRLDDVDEQYGKVYAETPEGRVTGGTSRDDLGALLSDERRDLTSLYNRALQVSERHRTILGS